MPVPEALSKWLIQRYPKPKIDAEWLEACYNWVIETKNLDPISDIAEIQTQVNEQLLCSDFSLSMVPATGLTANIKALKNTILRGPPILLELISLEEIGHSAFSLSNVRQIRIDREDLAGLGNSDEEGQDDDEGPIPRYPRSLLKMVLSDGHRQLVAIEDTRIEGLELGKTSLGCKMILSNPQIRRGIAFLRPNAVKILGYQTDDKEARQEYDFVMSLRRRMKYKDDDPGGPQPPPILDVPESEPDPEREQPDPPVEPQAVQQPRAQTPELPQEGSPSPKPDATLVTHGDNEKPSRSLPRESPQVQSQTPPPPQSRRAVAGETQAGATRSRFFNGPAPSSASGSGSNSSVTKHGASIDLARELILTPHRKPLITATSTSDDEEQEETHLRYRARLQGTFPSAQGTAGRTTEDVDMDVGLDENDGGSSDYDFSCDLDDDALAAAEEAEQKYKIDKSNTNATTSSQGVSKSTMGTDAHGAALEETRSQSTARTLVGTEERDITMIAEEGASRSSSRSSSHPAPISVSQPIRRAGSSRPVASSSQARSSQRVDLGVIDLVDEGKDGDKENVPVSKRQRRAAPSQEDIIEISD